MSTTFFDVSVQQLERLNARAFTNLLRHLLILEADRIGLSRSSIAVSLNLPAPDGGKDGEVEWSGDPEPERSDWIPARNVLFQCKATDMGPAACGGLGGGVG